MPRSNRRRPTNVGLDLERALGGFVRQERYAGGVWNVRRVAGRADAPRYRCPGCDQLFAGTVPHVVAWPTEVIGGFGGVADRRHWHTPCWQSRDRRPPRGSYR